MERLAAKRAAAAAATTGSEDGGVGSVLSDNSGAAPSAAHSAHTAVSLAGEMQVSAADEELVSPSKRARKCRGSGPTADDEVEGQTFHSFASGFGPPVFHSTVPACLASSTVSKSPPCSRAMWAQTPES
jgi:hypothetical protein